MPIASSGTRTWNITGTGITRSGWAGQLNYQACNGVQISGGEANDTFNVQQLPAGGTTAKFYGGDGDDVLNLTDGNLDTAIHLDENGALLAAAKVWTGTMGNGDYITTNCGDWGTTSGNGKVGTTGLKDNSWTDEEDVLCLLSAHLYCFEY